MCSWLIIPGNQNDGNQQKKYLETGIKIAFEMSEN
jgi:hypothetical protein